MHGQEARESETQTEAKRDRSVAELSRLIFARSLRVWLRKPDSEFVYFLIASLRTAPARHGSQERT